TEHLLTGAGEPAAPLMQVYYWSMLFVLVAGMFFLCWRFFRERFAVQHLVLTTLGFLGFQVAYFFLREPLSTWPRYFILYLPFVALLIPVSISKVLLVSAQPVARRSWIYVVLLAVVGLAGTAQIKNHYGNPYVDHGPDFRVVYRYLASHVAPEDKIAVGLPTNRMALIYYWPTPQQIRLGYHLSAAEGAASPRRIWTVSYVDEKSPAYLKFAEELEKIGYRLVMTQTVSAVTIRHFDMILNALVPGSNATEKGAG
ncbi:MAG: hypothetical protein ACRERS_06835, partial [Methylococcales bacterium]